MTDELQNALDRFADDLDAREIEAVIGGLMVTHLVRSVGLPLDPERLFAKGGYQSPPGSQSYDLAWELPVKSSDIRKLKTTRTRETLQLFNYAKRIGLIEAGFGAFLSDLVYAIAANAQLTFDPNASQSSRRIVGDIYEQALDKQEAVPGFWASFCSTWWAPLSNERLERISCSTPLLFAQHVSPTRRRFHSP